MKILYLFLNGTVALMIVALGIVTLVNNFREYRNRLFFAFASSVGIWIAACYISNDVTFGYIVSLYGNYFVFLFSYLASFLLLRFVIDITQDAKFDRIFRTLRIPLLTIGLLSVTPLVVAGVTQQQNVYAVNFGPFIGLYALALFGLLGATIFVLHQHNKSAGRSVRGRTAHIRILYRSLVIAIPILIVTQFIAPALTGSFEITDIGILAMAMPVMGLYYGVIRHRFLDIRLAAVRTVAYILALGTMAGIYFGLAYVASTTLFKGASTTGVSMSPVNIFLALILAFIFQPIKQFFDRITNHVFYRDRYSTDDLIADVGAIVTSTVDLKELLEEVAQTIGQTIKASGASFVVYREDKSPLQIGTKGHVYLTTSEIDDLRAYIDGKGSAIINVSERIEKTQRRSAIMTVVSRRRVALIVPLIERQGSIGFLLIDEQKGSGYVKHDIRALQTLTDELVVAVQNALSLQEVRDINTHLEQRINAATRQLRRSNNQLKALDETKDEFISMASHQLRTPLTSVKGYISMVLDGDVGEINPTQRKLLGEAFASSERMVHLIGDFLNVSRLQTGKFIIDQKPVDLTRVVAEEVESIGSLVTSHDMTLLYKPPKNIPIIQMDEDKIRQVIMNFIDNAVYYSHPGSTIVVKLARKGEFVELEVHDHGIGVPAEAQKRLFSKFFRAGNARRQRPDGTGIGLFLAQKVVTAQGGEIIFESSEGKGSVFGFRLPIHPKTPHHDDEE